LRLPARRLLTSHPGSKENREKSCAQNQRSVAHPTKSRATASPDPHRNLSPK